MSSALKIVEPEIVRDAAGVIQKVTIAFGLNHLIAVRKENDRLLVTIASTHRGVEVDATDIPGEFVNMIYSLEQSHQQLK